MKNWYSFNPIDTLFFRGAEPMIMGESHSSNYIFPPPAQTIEGAIRTYLFKKDKEKFKDIIKVGERKGGFNVAGPFFMYNDTLYIPAPYSWFYDKSDTNEKKKIYKLFEIKTNLIKISSDKLFWAKPESGELETLGGKWIKYEDLYSNEERIEFRDSSFFYVEEPHIGIALENKKVRKSHIYSFTHIRLNNNVKIVIAIDKNLPFDDENIILNLGAEQRFGFLKKLHDIDFEFEQDGKFFMSLNLLQGDNDKNNNVIATGKIRYIGGWDLAKGFHKEMIGYFPQGSVFSKKYENCIAIN